MTDELIEAYISGEMEQEARSTFELRLRQNPALAEEVRFHESMIDGIRDRAREKLKMRFLQLEHELQAQETSGKPRPEVQGLLSHLKWGLALMAILIPLVYFLIPSKDPVEIFEDYFRIYPNEVIDFSGREPSSLTDYERAFWAYEQHDFSQAIEAFEALEKNSTDRIAIPFYLGLSYLHQRQADLAVHQFWLLIKMEEESHEFLDPAHWYLSLALVLRGDLPDAKKELREISRSESPYAPAAARLLKRL